MSADGEAKTPESGMKKRNVAAGEAVSYMDHAKALQRELADDWATHFDDTKVRVFLENEERRDSKRSASLPLYSRR